MKKTFGVLILLMAFSTVTSSQIRSAQQTADVIYYGGKIITMWDAQPIVEAVAIRGNKFLRVGSNAEVLKTSGAQTQKIDLKGACVVPGLIDSHTHPITAALSEQGGALPPMNSVGEIQGYIRERLAHTPPDRLILVPKIFAPRLKEQRYPTRLELDAVSAERPIMVDNGYAAILNSFLLGKLNINRTTPQPSNGKIGKDEQGEPTGLILGAAQLLRELRSAKPVTPADLEWALKKMQQSYNQVGITSTIDRGQDAAGFRAYQELRRRGELTVRSSVTFLLLNAQGTPKQVREEIERIPFITGWGDDWFRVGPLKIVMDGGILTGTAYLREPYGAHTQVYGYEDTLYRGVLAVPRENVLEVAQAANELGWQMSAHVTGGGALDVLLDAYEATDRARSINERRFTVTHGNFPNQQAIERSQKLGLVFDCQPAWEHLYGDGIKDVFGPERLKDFLPLRALFDANLIAAGGSDHMIRFDPRDSINPFHPFYGMWMALTRQTISGAVLNPEQRITRAEALRMWTLNGAYLSFDEKIKGSVEPGKLADMVIIDKDYFSCPADEIKNIEPLLTIVDGKVVYRRLSTAKNGSKVEG